MRRAFPLLGLLPLLGVAELAAHHYFSTRAPGSAQYQALGRELAKLKRPGVPVVVAPAWAEPLVRAAAPNAFPVGELTRSDDRAFAELLEISLLGGSANLPEGFRREAPRTVGPFTLTTLKNLRPEPSAFDFVTAVDVEQVEVFLAHGDARTPCKPVRDARLETGGLHGHAAYPARRFQCSAERFVAVSLVEDAEYRPHRCILARLPQSGRVVLRFNGVPRASRFVLFGGFAYFLERDADQSQVRVALRQGEQRVGGASFSGAQGWSRRDLAVREGESVEVELESLAPSQSDFCFALEAR